MVLHSHHTAADCQGQGRASEGVQRVRIRSLSPATKKSMREGAGRVQTSPANGSRKVILRDREGRLIVDGNRVSRDSGFPGNASLLDARNAAASRSFRCKPGQPRKIRISQTTNRSAQP